MPLLCQWSRLFVSLLVGILSESECLCTILGMSFARLVVPPLPVSLSRVDRLVSGVLMVSGRNIVWMTNRAALFCAIYPMFAIDRYGDDFVNESIP